MRADDYCVLRHSTKLYGLFMFCFLYSGLCFVFEFFGHSLSQFIMSVMENTKSQGEIIWPHLYSLVEHGWGCPIVKITMCCTNPTNIRPCALHGYNRILKCMFILSCIVDMSWSQNSHQNLAHICQRFCETKCSLVVSAIHMIGTWSHDWYMIGTCEE